MEHGKNNTPGFDKREEAEVVYDHRQYWKLEMKRNDKRLIQSSLFLLQSNRANGNVSVMLYNDDPMVPSPEELRKVVGYIIDYASKANETEQQAREAMETLILSEESTTGCKWDLTRITVKGMNQLLRHKLTSKQETVCLISGLKLFDCSNTIEKISINQYKALNANGKMTSSDKLANYAHRNDHLDKSYYQFLQATKNKSDSAKTYIPHFVGKDTKHVYPITEKYANMVLLIYKAWRVDFEKSKTKWLEDIEDEKKRTLVHVSEEFLKSDECPEIVKFEQKKAKDYYENMVKEPQVATGDEPPEVDEQDTNIDPDTAEAVQLYSTICVDPARQEAELEDFDFGINFDWTRQNCTLPNGWTMETASHWLQNTVDLSTEVQNEDNENKTPKRETLILPTRSDGSTYEPEQLNDDQAQVFYQVMTSLKDWITYKREQNGKTTKPHSKKFQQLLMTVAGVGGSGKSTLVKTIITVIRRIFQFNSTAQVAAPTGSASFNGGGVTMHRLFGLPVGSSKGVMGAEKEKKLRRNFDKIVLLVIDERSMISAQDLAKIDEHSRLVVHRGLNEDKYFGGIPIVILVGDDYQLPPIMPGAAFMYSKKVWGDKQPQNGAKIKQVEECHSRSQHDSWW